MSMPLSCAGVGDPGAVDPKSGTVFGYQRDLVCVCAPANTQCLAAFRARDVRAPGNEQEQWCNKCCDCE